MNVKTLAAKAQEDADHGALRAKAARQAAKEQAQAQAPKIVRCRVLKAGDGKISTGQHVAGVGEVHFERGEEFDCAERTALLLEDRGYVEIEDAPAAD